MKLEKNIHEAAQAGVQYGVDGGLVEDLLVLVQIWATIIDGHNRTDRVRRC